MIPFDSDSTASCLTEIASQGLLILKNLRTSEKVRMNSGFLILKCFLIFKGVNMRNIHLNPCLGTWLELIHRNGFLCALYSEVFNSKDFSVGFFIELEILNGSKLFNQEREREKKTLNRLSIAIELEKKKLRSKNKHCIIQ